MDEASDFAPDIERHTLVVERLLADLCNDDDGQKPFSIPYKAVEDNHIITRELQFWLMRWRFDKDGKVVLHLSNEAINLYLRSLALDIADAQAATEAVVQAQLGSGRVEDAAMTAREARLQSIRLTEAIERLIRDIQRDLRRINWEKTGPSLLISALDHIKQRITVEGMIIDAAAEKLEHLQPGSKEAILVAQIRQLVGDCIKRHLALHEPLLQARTVFLDEQERQFFVEHLDIHQPDFIPDVLEPLLMMPRLKADQFIEQIFPHLFIAQPPSLFSLSDLTARQLQPRRAQRPNTTSLPIRTLIEVEGEPRHYTPEIYQRAEVYLSSLKGPIRLSDLLQQAHQANEPHSVLELLALLTLQWFAPDKQHGQPFQVEITSEFLTIDGILGNDLLISPMRNT